MAPFNSIGGMFGLAIGIELRHWRRKWQSRELDIRESRVRESGGTKNPGGRGGATCDALFLGPLAASR